MEKCCSCYDSSRKVCLGTKEIDYCSCEGDTHRCDFYPYKREKDYRTTFFFFLAMLITYNYCPYCGGKL